MPLFDQTRNPFDDVLNALERARLERKNVLLNIGGDWCIWCQRLEDFINQHPALIQLLDTHYVVVKVFISDQDETNAEFFSRLPDIEGVPHLLVYNGRGQLLCSQDTESLEAGDSYDYARLHAFLTEWSDWQRDPYDALSTDELRRRFERQIRPDQPPGPVLSA